MKDRRQKSTLVSGARWAAYAAAGAATAVAGEQAADAAITHITVNQTITSLPSASTTNTVIAQFALAGGVNMAFSHRGGTFSSFPSAIGVAKVRISGGAGGAIAGFAVGAFPYASNLAAGANISASPFLANTANATMAFVSGYANSEFLSAGIGFIGFRFDGGAGTQHGWARVNMSGAVTNEITLIDYAFADVGEAIVAGQTVVPGPASLALLALGATGLVGSRRKRAA